MTEYRVRYFNGDSRLRDFYICADNETHAYALCRGRYGSHIGLFDCKPTGN